jgi:hypothetical protein
MAKVQSFQTYLSISKGRLTLLYDSVIVTAQVTGNGLLLPDTENYSGFLNCEIIVTELGGIP